LRFSSFHSFHYALDLLQELGNIMQPIIVAEYEKEAEEKFGPKGGAATKDDGGVIDVEVEAMKTDNNQ